MHAISFSNIPSQPLTWLWPLYIPNRKITLLAGDPATGKTTLTLDLAARLSRALPMPPHQPHSEFTHSPILNSLSPSNPDPDSRTPDPEQIHRPQATFLLSPHDNPADTLRPKLEAMHADLALIHTLPDFHTLIPNKSANREIPPPTPLEILDQILASIPHLALLIIDPITHFLGLTDRYLPESKAQGSQSLGSSRSILHALSSLAEKHNLAILLTTRLIKKIPDHLPRHRTPLYQNALHQTLGSLAFPTTARSVLLTFPFPTTHQSPPSTTARSNMPSIANESSPDFITHNSEFRTSSPTHLLLPLKSNLSPSAQSLTYTLTNTIEYQPNPIDLDTLAPPPKSPGPNQLLANSAARWLKLALADGPVSSADLLKDAHKNAISNYTFQVARDQLGIIPIKQDWSGKWFCRLPDDTRPIPEDPIERELSKMFDHQNLREKPHFSKIEHQNLRRKPRVRSKNDQNLPQNTQKSPSAAQESHP